MTTFNDHRGLLDSSLNASQRWNGMTDRGEPVTLTYSFRNQSQLSALDPGLLDEAGANFFETMTSFQKARIRQVIETIESQVGVKFIEINSGGMLDFSGMSGAQGVSGFGYYPFVTGSHSSFVSSIILDTDEPNASYSPGGMMYMVMLHEIGHTLGLEHSFMQGPGSNGVSASLDNQNHTVMSYDEVSTFPRVYKRLDVDALEFLYGTKTVAQLGFTYDWDAAARKITITGTARNETLIGTNEKSTLIGGAGNDKLIGRDANDVLIGGTGADRLEGGGGRDTVDYSGASSGVRVNLSAPTSNTGEAAGDRFVSIEGIRGTDFDDILSGGGRDVRIDGGAGDDLISTGPFGRMYGGAGDDIFQVKSLPRVLNGGTGFDTVRIISSGITSYDLEALPSLLSLTSIEKFVGGQGRDFLRGDDDANIFEGGRGSDYLYGRGGDDELYGGESSDRLTGGAGADLLDGGAGFDSAVYGSSTVGITLDLMDESANTGDVIGDIFVSIERFIGSNHSDTLLGSQMTDSLYGGGRADFLNGRDGDDLLFGEDGFDSLMGGDGADKLFGGNGLDRAVYSDSTVGLTVDFQSTVRNTGIAAGDSYNSIEQISGSDFDDRLSGDAVSNLLIGGDGNDILDGRDGNDTLDGGAGDDLFIASSGVNRYTGGTGSDRVDYGRASGEILIDLQLPSTNTGIAAGDRFSSIEKISGSLHTDRINGDNRANELIGKAGADILNGRGGDDELRGGDDDDTLIGGAGADILNGGNGIDRATYIDALSSVRINLETPGSQGGDARGDTFILIEEFYASHHDDLLIGDSAENSFRGLNGDDLLYGKDGDDLLFGNGGDDVLFGGAGADRIDGGTGTDRANYGDSESGLTVDLQAASTNTGIAAGDFLKSIEDLQGSAFDDRLGGDAGGNALTGLGGADILRGRDGDDALNGGSGDDVLFGGAGADALNGGTGIDRAQYGDASGTVWADLLQSQVNRGIAAGDTYAFVEDLAGSGFDDLLRGDGGDNNLWGFGGSDRLNGREGADTLKGGAGNDLLIGGSGDDTLVGGGGRDSFLFTAPSEGIDTIVDFAVNTDSIRLDDAGFTSLSRGTFSASNFVNGAVALDADDFILYDSGALYYDADGSGAAAAIQFATVQNGAALDADDFQII